MRVFGGLGVEDAGGGWGMERCRRGAEGEDASASGAPASMAAKWEMWWSEEFSASRRYCPREEERRGRVVGVVMVVAVGEKEANKRESPRFVGRRGRAKAKHRSMTHRTTNRVQRAAKDSL